MGENLLPVLIDGDTMRRLTALNGLMLDAARAEALAPLLADLLAGDARLAALELGVLPAAGLPWAPFMDQAEKTGETGHGG